MAPEHIERRCGGVPFLLTKQSLQELHTEGKVLAAGHYLTASRDRDWEPDLWAEQRRIQQLQPGESLMTSGREFDAKYGIVTVPPVWAGGEQKEALHLAACYDSALRLANRRRCRSVAFPLLAADCHGFPKELDLQTAIYVIREFLGKRDLTVYLSIPDARFFRLPQEKYNALQQYLEDAQRMEAERTMQPLFAEEPEKPKHHSFFTHTKSEGTFVQDLLERMEQQEIQDLQLCRRANLDRKVFSKLRSNPGCQPSKELALAIALGLELDLEETRDFIGKAGYTLDPGSRFDNILVYHIKAGCYDHYEINQALFAFGEPLIGE